MTSLYLELEIAVLIKMNEIRKKYLVTPFFVDQLSFNLTSFRHDLQKMVLPNIFS
jgi:hypothetical protein